MTSAIDTSAKVRDVMTKSVITVGPEDAVHDALDLMSENKISAIPVIDKKERCIGILSASDLIDLTRALDMTFDEGDGDAHNHVWACAILRDQYGHELVESIMTKDVHMMPMETEVREAARLMLKDRTHHVPIVDETGHIRGMLSTFDLIKVLAV